MLPRLIATLGLLLALGQSCVAAQYAYKVHYATQSYAATGSWIAVAAIPGASKGYDGEAIWPTNPSPTGAMLGFRNVDGVDGWNTTTGWYTDNGREPVSSGSSVIIDNLYLWASTGTPSQSLQLQLIDGWLSPGLLYRLTLISVPTGVNYTGRTVWGIGDTAITLPFYSANNGTTGYRFRMEFAPIPEPSSLLALACGLAGLGGLVLRRRKA